MYHDYYRHKTWEAKHCWVNQFGIIEYDIFAHISPQHYVVKWKEEFERKEKHFDNKKEAKAFFRTVRNTATDFIRIVKWY
tara:strand:- start:832 stop:1071 length:240 start_codon:yes stop_codon:yes gene_type:complete